MKLSDCCCCLVDLKPWVKENPISASLFLVTTIASAVFFAIGWHYYDSRHWSSVVGGIGLCVTGMTMVMICIHNVHNNSDGGWIKKPPRSKNPDDNFYGWRRRGNSLY